MVGGAAGNPSKLCIVDLLWFNRSTHSMEYLLVHIVLLDCKAALIIRFVLSSVLSIYAQKREAAPLAG